MKIRIPEKRYVFVRIKILIAKYFSITAEAVASAASAVMAAASAVMAAAAAAEC